MKKQFKTVSIGVVFVGLLLLILAACTSGDGLMSAAGEDRAVPATPFLQGETVDYGDEVLVLREVSAEEGGNIELIVIWLPPKVALLTLQVNGSSASSSKTGEDTLIELGNPAAVVLLEFLDENNAVVKSCQVDINDVLAPQGDCAW